VIMIASCVAIVRVANGQTAPLCGETGIAALSAAPWKLPLPAPFAAADRSAIWPTSQKRRDSVRGPTRGSVGIGGRAAPGADALLLGRRVGFTDVDAITLSKSPGVHRRGGPGARLALSSPRRRTFRQGGIRRASAPGVAFRRLCPSVSLLAAAAVWWAL
jgi:hypothetical protein